MITRRRVIYVSGYDPQGPQGYYALFGSQLKRACALWHTKFVLGPLAIESADIASWTITMGGPNWQVFTRYDFVRQENIINANCAEPIIRQIFRAVRWMLDDLATGTTFRVFRANWQFGMHHLVLQLLLLTWIATSIAAGTLAWYIARHRVGVATPIGLGTSVAVFFAIFMALRPLANRWLVICVNNHWPYLREFGRGEATCFDRPIEIGAAHLKELVNANDADEVVIIGHSGGAPLAQCMVARALELDQDLGLRGPRIVVLTIGIDYSRRCISSASAENARDYSAVSNRTLDKLDRMPVSQGCPEFLGIRSCRRSRNSARTGALQSLSMAGTISRHAVSPILPQTAVEAFPAALSVHHGQPHAGTLRLLHADRRSGADNRMGEATERRHRRILA